MGKMARRAASVREQESLKSLTIHVETTGLERFLLLKFACDLATRGEDDARKRDEIIEQFEGADWSQDDWAGKPFPEERWNEPETVTLTRMTARHTREFITHVLGAGSVGRQARELLRLADRIDAALKPVAQVSEAS